VAAFAAIAAVLGLAACGENPSAPTPTMAILSPKANTQLKIGEIITIQWQCVNCEKVKGDLARVVLNSRVSDVQFTELGQIAMGFRTDSRSWVVGSVQTSDRGPMTMQPGFYYIAVYSYPPPNSSQWTEATSGFDGVLVELVR